MYFRIFNRKRLGYHEAELTYCQYDREMNRIDITADVLDFVPVRYRGNREEGYWVKPEEFQDLIAYLEETEERDNDNDSDSHTYFAFSYISSEKPIFAKSGKYTLIEEVIGGDSWQYEDMTWSEAWNEAKEWCRPQSKRVKVCNAYIKRNNDERIIAEFSSRDNVIG